MEEKKIVLYNDNVLKCSHDLLDIGDLLENGEEVVSRKFVYRGWKDLCHYPVFGKDICTNLWDIVIKRTSREWDVLGSGSYIRLLDIELGDEEVVFKVAHVEDPYDYPSSSDFSNWIYIRLEGKNLNDVLEEYRVKEKSSLWFDQSLKVNSGNGIYYDQLFKSLDATEGKAILLINKKSIETFILCIDVSGFLKFYEINKFLKSDYLVPVMSGVFIDPNNSDEENIILKNFLNNQGMGLSVILHYLEIGIFLDNECKNINNKWKITI